MKNQNQSQRQNQNQEQSAKPQKSQRKNNSRVPHISFSELKNWQRCPYYHKLTYIDNLKLFQGNEYTAFGTALHSVCEKILLEEDMDPPEYFKHMFSNNLNELTKKGVELKEDMIIAMEKQGSELSHLIHPAVKKYFKNYEVYSVEERLQEPIKEYVENEYDFKGYIDLVLKTEDGKYHVIDWKTCSWGWDSRKKADPMSVYQLIFYKHYFAKKHDIDPENIEVHFGLLKRTAKKNQVELFRVTSGKKRNENALKLLNKALYNINNKKYLKNKLSCKNCEFYKTEHCS
jgi:hypothetical protein